MLGGTRFDNGELITIADIESIDFHANVVSTASCMSGLVRFSAWNEFDSLTRAFLLSGANAVRSATGLLEDNAGRRAMTRIYSGYRRGETLSGALREAQRELIASPDMSEPRFWSPLYVTGKVDP
jgi:CHAT domain-containing protein